MTGGIRGVETVGHKVTVSLFCDSPLPLYLSPSPSHTQVTVHPSVISLVPVSPALSPSLSLILPLLPIMRMQAGCHILVSEDSVAVLPFHAEDREGEAGQGRVRENECSTLCEGRRPVRSLTS